MARQGVSRPKVVSSGRLLGSGRGQIHKKKVAGRCVAPLEPAYSLYSTDSEDQVETIHKGLDRCAVLLNGILQAEQAESKPKPQVTKTCTFKSKPKNLSRKFETDKKKHGKKANMGIHANKRPAPVQKTILSSKSHMSSTGRSDQIAGIRPAQGSQDPPSRLTHTIQAEHNQQNSLPLALSHPPASCNLPPSGQVHTTTAFNCRLTTSTPALSPQRSGSAHSEPCTSKCVLSSGHSSMRSVSAAHQPCPHMSSYSMPPTVQRQSPVTVSPVQNGSCTPVQHEIPIITSPVCSVSHVGSIEPNVLLASSIRSLTCPSSSLQETQVPNQPPVNQAQSDSNGPALMICNSQKQETLIEGGVSAEDEKDGMDTTPVRESSFQTSSEKLPALNHKPCSPEKTTQRVMTVKYLLGELKALVANQDSDAVRLISELEQSVSLLPVMVGSTNIQAEIALALQPLRSENVQLRRRLRILNQQLSERERAERRARPESCEMEVVALQSLNLTLQTQLNESRREFDDMQQENMRLRKAMEDKDSDLEHHKDLRELENSRLRLEINEALAEVQSCRNKLKDYEIEKTELTLRLQQMETEISRLQEVNRSLQRSQTKDTSRYSQMDVCQPNSHLTKTVLELHENAQREAAVSDKLSNSVKTYLQTMENVGQVFPPNHIQCRSQALQPSFSGQTSDTKICSPYKHKPTLETIVENVAQLDEQKKTLFGPLRESPVLQISSGLSGRTSITAKNQSEDVNVMKYMGRAFEKLDIVEGPLIQDASNDVQDCLSDDHEVALNLNPKNKGLSSQLVQSQHARRGLRTGVQSVYTGRLSAIDNTFSSCDIKSLASDWSINSWSTFNTQDEQNFRDGLAALDASIESLQKTLKIDRNK